MHNALPLVAQPIELNAPLLAVFSEFIHLRAGQGVPDGQVLVFGGHVMVGGGHDLLPAKKGQAAGLQLIKGLGAGHLMDQVLINVKHIKPARNRADHMGVPDLVK
ncbi:hypothetical protein ADICEAN_04158 [Cesiribacter andamanensis AMV16]|uniref:Uncharacterized protein n=1 Tax=Cesiribacter andamanensis AMV16 TaxID=1279009 RepID=M7N093_9BACT|nr:hypothetical protein ADICEAN_04158 [Cesiribacter andamanensis AMV16]